MRYKSIRRRGAISLRLNQVRTKMLSPHIRSCLLCLAVFETISADYTPDLGLSPEALDFSPKDHESNDFESAPYPASQGGGGDKLPAPTSYASFNLESKNAVPVKVWWPQKKQEDEPEYPQEPLWLQQDSGSDGGGGGGGEYGAPPQGDEQHHEQEPTLIQHPIPAPQPSGGYGSFSGGHQSPPALARHPSSPPAGGPQQFGPSDSYGGPPPSSSSSQDQGWQPSQGFQPEGPQESQGYSYR